MSDERERQHLARAEQHVADCRRHVRQQVRIVRRLRDKGANTESALYLLVTLLASLHALRGIRRQIRHLEVMARSETLHPVDDEASGLPR